MIYLDNAATSFPKAPGTAEAVCDFLTGVGANSGRSSHKAAQKASSVLFNCREALAELLGVTESERIIFTSNTTESLNMALFGMIQDGDTVLTSSMEHNSVMRPLRFMEQTKGITVKTFEADSFGFPRMDNFRENLSLQPDFLVFSAASNVTGTIVPFREMAEEASKRNIPVCVDGAQLTGSYPVSLQDTKIDLFAFPGHKGLMGPTGTGGLYIGERVNPRPLLFGGTGSRSSEELQPDFLPDKYESGTPNIAGIAGLLRSVRFILDTGTEYIHRKEDAVTRMLIEGLQGLRGIRIYTPPRGAEHSAVVSVTHDRKSVSDITEELERRDIAVRMGLHCAPAAHRITETFSTGGTVRFSPGFFTTENEITETIRIMKEILQS